LPETITAKISSEGAGYVSFTPVARQEIPLRDLVERVLAVTGKDLSRIQQVLERGSFVSGELRYRWQPIRADEEDLRPLVDTFPEANPKRPFDAAKCAMVILRSERGSVTLSKEAASGRRLLRRRSYWDVLIPLLEGHAPAYQRYSYSDKADVYSVSLPYGAARTLQDEAGLMKYSTLVQKVKRLALTSVELYVER
jgi:hypothetical protein